MVISFEEIKLLSIRPGRGWKYFSAQEVPIQVQVLQTFMPTTMSSTREQNCSDSASMLCLARTIFMQGTAQVKMLYSGFSDKPFYRRTLHQPPLSSCVSSPITRPQSMQFWLWRNLKYLVSRNNSKSLLDLTFCSTRSTFPSTDFAQLENIPSCDFSW